jgi:hypothetical protein
MFSIRASFREACLADPPWMIPAFSTRNSTWRRLWLPCTASPTSMVTVPTRGFGIRPRGPRTLPKRPTKRHHVRRRDAAIEVDRATLDFLDQLFGPNDIGAGCSRLFRFRTAREHSNASGPARTVRQVAHTANDLVGVLGSTPRFIAISIVSSNFALVREISMSIASSIGYDAFGSMSALAASIRLPPALRACLASSGDTFAISLTLSPQYPSNARSQQWCAPPARYRQS